MEQNLRYKYSDGNGYHYFFDTNNNTEIMFSTAELEKMGYIGFKTTDLLAKERNKKNICLVTKKQLSLHQQKNTLWQIIKKYLKFL